MLHVSSIYKLRGRVGWRQCKPGFSIAMVIPLSAYFSKSQGCICLQRDTIAMCTPGRKVISSPYTSKDWLLFNGMQNLLEAMYCVTCSCITTKRKYSNISSIQCSLFISSLLNDLTTTFTKNMSNKLDYGTGLYIVDFSDWLLLGQKKAN